jgi:plasmid maintenance system killer protein
MRGASDAELVIRSCGDKETEKPVRNLPSRRFQSIERAARVKLAYLKSARSLRDLSLPGLRLEKPSGDRQRQYSIRVNGAYNVEITDYH